MTSGISANTYCQAKGREHAHAAPWLNLIITLEQTNKQRKEIFHKNKSVFKNVDAPSE